LFHGEADAGDGAISKRVFDIWTLGGAGKHSRAVAELEDDATIIGMRTENLS